MKHQSQPASYDLKQRSKSFTLASRFLQSIDREKIETLYRFLRWADDLVDEGADREFTNKSLQTLKAVFTSRDSVMVGTCVEEIKDFLLFCSLYTLPKHLLRDFVEGQISDFEGRVMEDEDALVRYCYRVAGTVGLMILVLLREDNANTRPHAMELGVAMQLTNIARDVREDGLNGRVYLPSNLIEREVVLRAVTVGAEADVKAVNDVLLELLALSRSFYRSADIGLEQLSRRNRQPLELASRLYEAIGSKIESLISKGQVGPLRKRIAIGCLQKLFLALQCLYPIDRRTVMALRGTASPVLRFKFLGQEIET